MVGTMKLRYGEVPLSAVSWRYLPTGTGKSLSGYVERKFNAGPGAKTWTFTYLEKGQQFFTRLKASVAEHGFRNPVFLLALTEGNFLRYGGSRLWAAHELKLETIPAIVADWVDRFADYELLETEEAVRAKFTDQPETINLDPADVQLLHCPHTHLPGSPRNPGALARDKYEAIAAHKRRLQECAATKG